MSRRNSIFVVPWNDDPAKSRAAARSIYPQDEIVVVDKRALRESSFLRRVQLLRQLRGKAVIFCFRSLGDLNAPLLLGWISLLHRCPLTVLLDESGHRRTFGRWAWLGLSPITAFAVLCDGCVLLLNLVRLKAALLRGYDPVSFAGEGLSTEIAYLFPHPMLRSQFGGAMSHVRGFLGGLKEVGGRCKVYTGSVLPQEFFSEQHIPLSGRAYLFWEAMAMAYNKHFARVVRTSTVDKRPAALYQRHSRFGFAGALLARELRVPLVLEYNGSEVWVARNWDPVHFRGWLRLCEEYSLKSASLIVVVSEVLKRELIGRGIPEEKILVNPNGVDPRMFHPGCGGAEVRRELGIAPDEVVAGFVGTFSYWHGIPVLQEAADRLLRMAEEDPSLGKLRFLLVGDGPLRGEAAEKLKRWVDAGKVIFTGSVPHQRVPAYLDAADILLSPHIPFKDGSEFFGSPTKLFEYMAMGKAIIASKLGQIGEVLAGQSGWLVKPEDVDELVAAIAHLAHHPELRGHLGKRAREAVLARHSWFRNALNLIETVGIRIRSANSTLESVEKSSPALAAPPPSEVGR